MGGNGGSMDSEEPRATDDRTGNVADRQPLIDRFGELIPEGEYILWARGLDELLSG
jgi:hypothetical protein